MKKLIVLAISLPVVALLTMAQQRRGAAPPAKPAAQHAQPNRGPAPGVGGGHIPARGPSGPIATEPHTAGHPAAPHVHANGDVWIGRAQPNDPRYRLAHPFQYGHFPGAIGPAQIWRLEGGGPSHFLFGGYAFMVASADMALCANWLWDSDDIVIYDCPDQPGWYVAYNVRLGTWVHVEYMGAA